jgi:hypothetical protein
MTSIEYSDVSDTKCCRFLTDGVPQNLPFSRTIAIGFYDGPTDGFTECSRCHRAYHFRKLEWDELQELRIFGFAPVQSDLDTIARRLGIQFNKDQPVSVVPPLDDAREAFLRKLLADTPVRVAAIIGWPGQSSVWRDVRGQAVTAVTDWFAFLGLTRRRPK